MFLLRNLSGFSYIRVSYISIRATNFMQIFLHTAVKGLLSKGRICSHRELFLSFWNSHVLNGTEIHPEKSNLPCNGDLPKKKKYILNQNSTKK